MTFTPLHGALFLGRHPLALDVYQRVGLGAVGLVGDHVWLGEGPPPGPTWRPTTDIALGAQVFLWPPLALAVELHRLMYIDVVYDTTLEMKNNAVLTGGISVWLGG